MKPGMLVQFPNGSIDLVTAISKKLTKDIEYTHIQLVDPYWGRMIGSTERNTEVKVIQGEKKKVLIQEILEGLWKRRQDVKEEIELVELIKAMDSM